MTRKKSHGTALYRLRQPSMCASNVVVESITFVPRTRMKTLLTLVRRMVQSCR